MQRGEANLPTIGSYRRVPDRASITILANEDEQPFLHNGVETSASEIVIEKPDIARQRTFGPNRWASMSLPHPDPASAGRLLAHRELFAKSTWRLRAPPGQIARLRTLHANAVRPASGASGGFAHPETVRSMSSR